MRSALKWKTLSRRCPVTSDDVGVLLAWRLRGGAPLRAPLMGGGGGVNAGVSAAPCTACGGDVIERTVIKASANKGRPFQKCKSPKGPRCHQFFHWADEPPRQQQNQEAAKPESPTFGAGNTQTPSATAVPMPPRAASGRVTQILRVPRPDGEKGLGAWGLGLFHPPHAGTEDST